MEPLIRLLITDAAHLPFRNAAFDCVVAMDVIEHIEDDSAALRNIARLLSPGGHAVLIVPAHRWLFGTLDRFLGHFRRYSLGQFDELLRGVGLEVRRSRLINPLGVPGWWLNGRVLGRRVLPSFQVAIFGRLTWLVKLLTRWNPPFGISILAVARKPL